MGEESFGQFWITCSKINVECYPETLREQINKDGHLIGYYVKRFLIWIMLCKRFKVSDNIMPHKHIKVTAVFHKNALKCEMCYHFLIAVMS